MSEIFLDVLNTSIAASWVVLAVLLARLLLRKAPRNLVCGLWSLVALRLLFGGTFEVPFSLMPSSEVIPPESLYDAAPVIDSGVPIIDSVVNPIYTESFRASPVASVNPLQVWTAICANLWVLGMIAMGLWAAWSWLRVRRQVRERVSIGERLYLCDRIDSPFIFGFFRPNIYLPSDLEDAAKEHVIAHEKAHIVRKDHLWKPLGFALLTVNWFNPFMWLAYSLLCRDIEMACDERVVRDRNLEYKKAYSTALLACSVTHRYVSACPLAFGEVGVKARIKSVLSYKKPAFWVILITLVLTVVLAVGLLTDPVSDDQSLSEANRLGIHLSVENVTPSGLTLVCTQDGTPWRAIYTGSYYSIARWEETEGNWVFLPMPENTGWTTIAYGVPLSDTICWNLNWTWLYGELEPGQYRIYKHFSGETFPPGAQPSMQDTVNQSYYVEFSIE